MNTLKRRIVSGVAVLLVAGGCANGELPDYTQVGPLRVLALQAEPPEVDPSASTTVTITPVVSDMNAARTLTYSAVGCLDPGVGYGAKPICGADAVTLASGPVGALDTTAKTTTGVAPSFTLTVPTTLLAQRNAIEQYNGVAYLVLYTLTATSSSGATTQVVAYKRVIGSTRPVKNKNPIVSDVLVGTQSLTAYLTALTLPASTASLTPSFGAVGAETYTQLSSIGELGTVTETLTTTWFFSDGSLSNYRTEATGANTWTPPSSAPAFASGVTHGYVFVAVTRDGHGGEGYKVVIK